VSGLAAAFDDSKVAQLLATSLALEGKASDRLATIFNTIAPDEDRKRRVLTMAKTMLSEQDFGKTGQFRAVWSSMETLLLAYDETPYVSAAYQATLEGAVARGEWRDGWWTVVIARPLVIDGASTLRAGAATSVAWAVWQGGEREVGSRKSVAINWVPLKVQ